MNENYQKLLDSTLKSLENETKRPSLLLHSCCGPCSSYVLEYLTTYFDITILYYNPNIFPEEEFHFRAEEQERLIDMMGLSPNVKVIKGNYNSSLFYALARGHESENEGGERCFACYKLRLQEAANVAKQHDFDYFTTTLSISPHKNAAVLNEIGKALSAECGIPYLYSDFKKRDGYRRSCALSAQYGLYRQDYCGCVYSKQETERRKQNQTGKEANL